MQAEINEGNKSRLSKQLKNKRKAEKKLTKEKSIEKDKTNTRMEIDFGVKELPPSVKCLHPESFEFIVPGNGACCLNCLAAFIYLDPRLGPPLERDLNTHMATYREEYLKRLVFPRSQMKNLNVILVKIYSVPKI